MRKFILKTADGSDITQKTEVNKLVVVLDTPLKQYGSCIFMYDKSQVPNPENINVPGIYMHIEQLQDKGAGVFLIKDATGRNFELIELRN